MVRSEIKSNIIPLLKENIHGLSVNKIAKALNAARDTINKYLNELKHEGEVDLVPTGGFKVWVYTGMELRAQDKFMLFIIDLITQYTSILQKQSSKPFDYKQAGRELVEKIEFGDYIFTFNLIPKLSVSELMKGPLEALIESSRELINIIIRIIGEGEIDAPTIFKDMNMFSYRVRNVSHVENPYIFKIIEGIIEKSTKNDFDLSIEVNFDVNKSEKFLDVKVKLVS